MDHLLGVAATSFTPASLNGSLRVESSVIGCLASLNRVRPASVDVDCVNKPVSHGHCPFAQSYWRANFPRLPVVKPTRDLHLRNKPQQSEPCALPPCILAPQYAAPAGERDPE